MAIEYATINSLQRVYKELYKTMATIVDGILTITDQHNKVYKEIANALNDLDERVRVLEEKDAAKMRVATKHFTYYDEYDPQHDEDEDEDEWADEPPLTPEEEEEEAAFAQAEKERRAKEKEEAEERAAERAAQRRKAFFDGVARLSSMVSIPEKQEPDRAIRPDGRMVGCPCPYCKEYE